MVEHRSRSGPQPRDTPPVPGSDGFIHEPVMISEVVDLVTPVPAGTFVDATVGGAGHSSAILAANDRLKLVGIDRDSVALTAATVRLDHFGDRVQLHQATFDELGAVLASAGGDEDSTKSISGFLFDLGVSSPQLDNAERGFSFRHDGPLDMRMDRSDASSNAFSAATVVNEYEHGDLARVIRTYGDEKFASRIASAIISARPLSSTVELAAVVVNAIPAATRRTGGHPAKRTFQAIRIEVNSELAVLAPALEAALDALVEGGRGLVLTYHSGEDRIVKNAFRQRTQSNVPAGLPVQDYGVDFAIVRPASRQPTQQEVERNPRARSARLRAIERIAA